VSDVGSPPVREEAAEDARRNGNGNGSRRFARSVNPAIPALRIPAVRRAARDTAVHDAEARATSRPIREGERTSEVLGRDALHRRLLATADVISAVAVVNLALVLGGAEPAIAIVAVAPLVVLIAKIIGLYDRDEHIVHKTTLDEAPAIFQLSMAFTLIVWLLDDLLASAALGKHQVVFILVTVFLTVGFSRALARWTALRLAPLERILILGSASEAARVSDKLLTPLGHCRGEVVGRVAVDHEPRDQRGDDVLGILADLDYVLARHRVDRVVICPHGESASDMLDTIRLAKGLGVKVSVMPRLFEVVGSSVEFDDLGGLTLLGLRRYDLTKSSAFLKRTFDVLAATTGLLLLAPLMITMALAVKLTSRGPVLFRQPRVGRGGKTFDMLKFRTMYDGADRQKALLVERNEADGLFKIADDPRVTAVGRILRRTSLDELPQLLNVVRGEMSLVGPRPLVTEEDARIEGWFRRRLDVTPGMTGAWQVLGSSRIPLRDMVTIDYLYRTNWSLWLDMKILLRTVPHVLARRGI
jgi:exopolysaccharide biosynthesis polyprenyl glycosylphosphotransferase